eukprot:138973-Prorocentrum_lima.AAC.1
MAVVAQLPAQLSSHGAAPVPPPRPSSEEAAHGAHSHGSPRVTSVVPEAAPCPWCPGRGAAEVAAATAA